MSGTPWVWPPINVNVSGGVTSVFGRAGAVAAALGDYAASLITNDSLVAGATVKDALNTLLGAGAPVSSVFGRTGAVVAALNDYAASLISNDSLVAGATVKDALNALRAGTTFPATFVTAPASPNPADFDASLATSPDLATNGFLVHLQNSPWTTLTRVGDVDMFSNTAPTGNTYQSTLMGGLLVCRFPIGVSVAITKQVDTSAAGVTVKTHAWLTRLFDATNATAGLLLTWYIGGLSNPAGAAKYGDAGTQIVYGGILNQHWELTSWVVGNAPIALQNVNVGTDFGDVVNYLRLAQMAAQQAYAVRAGTPISFLMPAAPFSSTMTLGAQRAGLIVNNGTSQFVMIDFVRQEPFSQFP
jgi:hypothetical protein